MTVGFSSSGTVGTTTGDSGAGNWGQEVMIFIVIGYTCVFNVVQY